MSQSFKFQAPLNFINSETFPCCYLFVLAFHFQCFLCSLYCCAAKQAQQINCHVKQKQAWKPPLAVWLTRLNKQLTGQIIHVNGTENENQDLQCIWQHGGYMLPLDGWMFSDYLGLFFFPLVLKGPKPITVRLKFNISERLNDDNL